MFENCCSPHFLLKKGSLYGDIPDLDVEKGIEIAQDRKKRKKLGRRNVANFSMGTLQMKKKEDDDGYTIRHAELKHN